ncbi:MAG: cytochrome c oxidase cbb3-type subunit 4 [Gammaproteobacteria bacterium]|jgi:cytochrome c oxidase cbb3-type subunit 4
MFASIHAWWTAALLVTFIGIVIWAYSSTRNEEFEEAARLALDEDEDPSCTSARTNGNVHG